MVVVAGTRGDGQVIPIRVGAAGFQYVSVQELIPDGTNRMPSGDATARPIFIKLTDGTTDAGIEPSSTGLFISRAAHYRIAHSNMWMSSYLFSDVDADALAVFQIKVGAGKNAHGYFKVTSEAKVIIHLLENPTLNTDGTGIAEHCLNRQTVVAPGATCYHTPDVSAYGTTLETAFLGSAGVLADIGGSQRSEGYWLLKKSEDYLVRVQNVDASSKDICIAYTWHEH